MFGFKKKVLQTTGKAIGWTMLTFVVLPVLAQTEQKTKVPALKDVYQNYFPMGVAITPRNLNGDEADLIKQQFNSITAENAMKMGPIQPEEGRFYWDDADAIVGFAVSNGMKIRGHALCWHSQAPKWFFTDSDGKDVSREVLLARLKQHITEVAGRYKGKIYAWDVVNEAVPDTGSELYRQSKFYTIIGEDYIQKAFEYAHEVVPEARLFYNDYGTEGATKQGKIYRLLKGLKEKGVPVHGVGLQGHWSVYKPSAAELEKSIELFSSLGLEVQITELDVSVHKQEGKREKRPSDDEPVLPETMELQAKQYQAFFEVLRKHRNKVTAVTFWNVSDRATWLNFHPIRGRKDYPLLFDQQLKPKEAFWRVVKFVE